MNPHAIEVAFDYDYRVVNRNHGSVEIIEFQRLVESAGQFVLRNSSVQRAAGIRDDLTLPVVNRNHDPSVHQTRSVVESNPELNRGRSIDPSLRQIRMSMIH